MKKVIILMYFIMNNIVKYRAYRQTTACKQAK